MSDHDIAGESGAAAPVSPEGERRLALTRLAAGAAQGLALYLLYRWVDDKVWPATDPYWLTPLALVFLFVPVLLVQGVGTLRLRTLLPWLVCATAILAGLGWYDVWRNWPVSVSGQSFGDGEMTFGLVAATFVGLFVAQALILAGDGERKFIASYPAYFESGTKLAVQFAATIAFVLVFWGVLWLGAVLFNLIKLDFLETLIQKDWFAIPATTLASAAAIHVTDVRARLWTGIRTVALTLLSWLLPLMTLIAAGFTASLLFTGLTPLWATRSAALSKRPAAGVVVVLLNTAFQDGAAEHSRARVFRYAELVAGIVLVPLVALAGYAVWLRVAQYGWTVERVVTAATILIALCYAVGYAVAAVLSLTGGAWMRLVAPVNVATAFAVIAVLLALFTPVGDPARLSVASQIGRLKSGAVTAKAFDFGYLRLQGGRYGHEALVAIAKADFGRSTALVHDSANAILSQPVLPAPTLPLKGPANLVANVTVYPKGAALPASFVHQDWSKAVTDTDGIFVPDCLRYATSKCDAFLMDFAGSGHDDVFVLASVPHEITGPIYREQPDGHWRLAGRILVPACGEGAYAALQAGNFQLVPRPNRDLRVGGVTFQFLETTGPEPVCRH